MKYEQVNKEIVKIQRVTAPVGQMQLKSLIEAHVVSIFQFITPFEDGTIDSI